MPRVGGRHPAHEDEIEEILGEEIVDARDEATGMREVGFLSFLGIATLLAALP